MIDRQVLNKSGLIYFVKNNVLAVDVVTILDCICTKFQKEIKLNLCKYADLFTPINKKTTAEKKMTKKIICPK